MLKEIITFQENMHLCQHVVVLLLLHLNELIDVEISILTFTINTDRYNPCLQEFLGVFSIIFKHANES